MLEGVDVAIEREILKDDLKRRAWVLTAVLVEIEMLTCRCCESTGEGRG